MTNHHRRPRIIRTKGQQCRLGDETLEGKISREQGTKLSLTEVYCKGNGPNGVENSPAVQEKNKTDAES